MADEQRKPWDARLLERIQGGASEAKGGRTMTPKQRTAYAVLLTAWLSFLVSTNGRPAKWWLYPLFVVLAGGSQLGAYLWERRRGAKSSREVHDDA
jgi:hypothetical protein